MTTTRTLARLTATAATAGWLLGTAAAGAIAAPAPNDPMPSAPASVHYVTPTGGYADDETREYLGQTTNKVRSYGEYLARDDARAAAAARLPSLPAVSTARAGSTAAHASSVRVEHSGLGAWAVALAAGAGLLAGAGLMGAAGRLLRPGGRLRHA